MKTSKISNIEYSISNIEVGLRSLLTSIFDIRYLIFNLLPRPVFCTLALLLVFAFDTHAQDSLTLEQAIRYAWDNNTQIQRSELERDRATYNARQQYASFFPSLSASASNNYNFGRTIDPTTNQFNTSRINTNFYSVNSDVLLFNSGQMRRQYKAAQEGVSAQMNNVKFQQQDVALNVANLYLQVLMLDERERQLAVQLGNSRQAAERIMARVRAGAEAPARELEAKAQIAVDSAQLVDIRTQIVQGKLQLKAYMNYDPLLPINLTRVTASDTQKVYDQAALQQALSLIEQQPSVKSAQDQIEQAEWNLKAAESNRWPKIYGSASLNTGYSSGARRIDGVTLIPINVGYVNGDTSQVVQGVVEVPQFSDAPYGSQIRNNFGQQVGMRLIIPVFNGLQNQYNVQLNEISLDNAQLARTEAVNQVKNNIIQAYEGMRQARANYLAQQQRLDAQEALFQTINYQYNSGVIGYFDWFTASSNLSLAQSQALSAKYNYIFQTKVFELYLNPQSLLPE